MTLSNVENIESRDYYKTIIDLAEKKPNEEVCGFGLAVLAF